MTPCSVILYRFDDDDDDEKEEEGDKTESTSNQGAEMNGTDHGNIDPMVEVQSEQSIVPLEIVALPANCTESTEAIENDQSMESIDSISTVESLTLARNIAESIISPPVQLTESVPTVASNVPTSPSSIQLSTTPPKPRGRPKRRPDASIAVSFAPIAPKRLKIPTQKSLANAQKHSAMKKAIKTKPMPPAQQSVCFLCGRQFPTTFQLAQHEKTHIARTESPVFPCNICHKNVKNLKMHLRLHKKESGKRTKTTATAKSIDSTALNGANKLGEQSTRDTIADNSKVTKEEASSSTDAVVSSNKEPDTITSNEAQTNSTDSNGSFIPNGKSPHTDSLSSQKTMSKSSFMPPIIVDEYPANVHKISIIEPIGVNEPSQSTETSNESAEQSESDETVNNEKDDNSTMEHEQTTQPNGQQSIGGLIKCSKCSRRFSTEARVIKHQKKHTKKKNCKVCGKLLALSYVKMHIKLKHPTTIDIPLNIQALNIQDEAP